MLSYLLGSILVTFFTFLAAVYDSSGSNLTALLVSVFCIWPAYAVVLGVAGLVSALIYFFKWVARVTRFVGRIYAA